VYPVTSAHRTLEQIRSMTDDLLEAHAVLLPEALRPDTPRQAPVG
jgi:alpha-galactosidase